MFCHIVVYFSTVGMHLQAFNVKGIKVLKLIEFYVGEKKSHFFKLKYLKNDLFLVTLFRQ